MVGSKGFLGRKLRQTTRANYWLSSNRIMLPHIFFKCLRHRSTQAFLVYQKYQKYGCKEVKNGGELLKFWADQTCQNLFLLYQLDPTLKHFLLSRRHFTLLSTTSKLRSKCKLQNYSTSFCFKITVWTWNLRYQMSTSWWASLNMLPIKNCTQIYMTFLSILWAQQKMEKLLAQVLDVIIW